MNLEQELRETQQKIELLETHRQALRVAIRKKRAADSGARKSMVQRRDKTSDLLAGRFDNENSFRLEDLPE